MEPSEYDQMVKERSPTRSMLPSMYTTYWFQSMAVGGDNPAPSAIAPRLMDAILLDGHLGVCIQGGLGRPLTPTLALTVALTPTPTQVIFQFGLGLLKSHERELLKLKGDGLADALRTLPTRCADKVDALMEKAHEYHVSNKVVLGTREAM